MIRQRQLLSDVPNDLVMRIRYGRYLNETKTLLSLLLLNSFRRVRFTLYVHILPSFTARNAMHNISSEGVRVGRSSPNPFNNPICANP